MTFPVVSATDVSGALSGSSQNLPVAAHSAGDRLLVLHAVDGGASNYVSHSAGWDLLAEVSSGTTCFGLLFEQKSAASASETLTVTLGGSRTARAIAYTITGSDSAVAAEVTTASGPASGNPTPVSLSPSWGAADTLWVAALTKDSGSIALGGYPADYLDNQVTNSGGTTSTPLAAICSRELNTASETPGTWDVVDQWCCYTIGIKPAGGGGVDGSVTLTLADTTSTITGTTTILTNLASLLADATSNITTISTIIGNTGATLADTTSAISGTVGTIGTTGTVASTLDNTTLSSSGTTTVLLILANTLENTQSNINTTPTVVGQVTLTLDDTTSAIFVLVGDQPDTTTWRTLTGMGT